MRRRNKSSEKQKMGEISVSFAGERERKTKTGEKLESDHVKQSNFKERVKEIVSSETPEFEENKTEAKTEHELPKRIRIPWDPPKILKERFCKQ